MDAFPYFSGFVVLYRNRSLRADFTALEPASVYRKLTFLLILVLLFTVISILPTLELIELDKKSTGIHKIWIGELPFWQETIILISGLLLLFVGYVTNSTPSFSINRVIVLYSCFVVFLNQILLVLILFFAWFKIQGGFWSTLAAVLLAAVLALDYWDAKSFGQYVRRYFFLTCTKGLSFIFLWLCFFGLPQKAASVFSTYYYEKLRPAVAQIPLQHLIFSDRDRFKSVHEAGHRLRVLYAKAFLTSRTDELSRITRLIDEGKGSIYPADMDICQLTDLVRSRDIRSTSLTFDKIPLFRPVHPDWDVMLTALVVQGTISGADLDKIIAGFKTMLPKTCQGRLPDIGSPYKALFVSLATGTHTDFLPPRFDLLEALSDSHFCPVLSLRLAGKDHWAALLQIDRGSGIGWFRIENPPEMKESIQLLFDSGESSVLRDEILSRFLVPLSLDYLRGVMEHYSGPLVVFSKKGITAALPDRFAETDLGEVKRAVAVASDPFQSPVPVFGNARSDSFSEYSTYIRAIASIKALLKPAPYRGNLFPRPAAATFGRKGPGRLDEIDRLLKRIGPLRDSDRMDIAYLLVKNHHVYGAPDLFVRLAGKGPSSTDLIDCRDAFIIGRQLFLLGYHQEAYGYLELASLRHPFNSEYELWYHIARVKLQKPQASFYSPPYHKPHLQLYYQTIDDIRKGKDKSALKRLEKALEKDSHNSLANHLQSKYFRRPLDEQYFFPTPEGL